MRFICPLPVSYSFMEEELVDAGNNKQAVDADSDLEAGHGITGEKCVVGFSTDFGESDAPEREAHLVLRGRTVGDFECVMVFASERGPRSAEPGWATWLDGVCSPATVPRILGCIVTEPRPSLACVLQSVLNPVAQPGEARRRSMGASGDRGYG
ncbi:hypothetical protein B0H12DRAFT_1122781 [Mycena haematopus]|nr:hypothetical protein B0H12DRAFT_1122781 [Mycena haematopus]